MEHKKTIVGFRIITFEYLFVRIFILNKALWSLLTKFAQKRYFWTKFKKAIVEFKVSNLEYPFLSSFILNKALSSFETKFAKKKSSLETKFRTLFWITVKQLTMLWVNVGQSVKILDRCGS